MDLSLDDIITQTKGSRGGGRGRGRGRGAGRGGFNSGARTFGGASRPRGVAPNRSLNFRRSGNADGVWAHDKFMDVGGGYPRTRSGGMAAARGGGAKIVIGNLHYAVSEADLKELFGEFGPILDATINYDMSGRSLGKADLTFHRRSSAQAAIAKYSGVPLDGRPMDIQWATPTGLSAPPVPRVLARVSGGRVGGTGGRGGVGNKPGRGGRGGGGRGGKTKPPTAEELDAELDAYVKQSAK